LRVSEVGFKSFVFHYAIITKKNGIEKIAAIGKSTQVMYHLATQRTIPIPKRLIAQWQNFENPEHFTTQSE